MNSNERIEFHFAKNGVHPVIRRIVKSVTSDEGESWSATKAFDFGKLETGKIKGQKTLRAYALAILSAVQVSPPGDRSEVPIAVSPPGEGLTWVDTAVEMFQSSGKYPGWYLELRPLIGDCLRVRREGEIPTGHFEEAPTIYYFAKSHPIAGIVAATVTDGEAAPEFLDRTNLEALSDLIDQIESRGDWRRKPELIRAVARPGLDAGIQDAERPDLGALVREYLKAFCAGHRTLPQYSAIDLEAVFVPPDFSVVESMAPVREIPTFKDPIQPITMRRERRLRSKTVTFEKVLDRLSAPGYHLSVIQGSAGAGKTIALRMLGLRLAERSIVVPILIELTRYTARARNERSLAGKALEIVAGSELGSAGPTVALMEEWISQGSVILLLDGLDEVLRQGDRKDILEEIHEILRKSVRAKIVLSARPEAVSGAVWGESTSVLELRPFEQENIVQMLEGYAAACLETESAQHRAAELIREVRDESSERSAALRELLGTPWYAFIAIRTLEGDFPGSREIPRERLDLLIQYDRQTLGDRPRMRSERSGVQLTRAGCPDPGTTACLAAAREMESAPALTVLEGSIAACPGEAHCVRRVLGAIALRVHEKQMTLSHLEIVLKGIRDAVKTDVESRAGAAVCHYLCEQVGVMRSRQEKFYEFEKQIIQEFYAAWALANSKGSSELIVDVRALSWQPWWHETIALCAGLIYRQKSPIAPAFSTELIGLVKEPDNIFATRALLAARCWAESGWAGSPEDRRESLNILWHRWESASLRSVRFELGTAIHRIDREFTRQMLKAALAPSRPKELVWHAVDLLGELSRRDPKAVELLRSALKMAGDDLAARILSVLARLPLSTATFTLLDYFGEFPPKNGELISMLVELRPELGRELFEIIRRNPRPNLLGIAGLTRAEASSRPHGDEELDRTFLQHTADLSERDIVKYLDNVQIPLGTKARAWLTETASTGASAVGLAAIRCLGRQGDDSILMLLSEELAGLEGRKRFDPQGLKFVSAVLDEASRFTKPPPAELLSQLKTLAAKPDAIHEKLCESACAAIVRLGGAENGEILQSSLLRCLESRTVLDRKCASIVRGILRSSTSSWNVSPSLGQEIIRKLQSMLLSASPQQLEEYGSIIPTLWLNDGDEAAWGALIKYVSNCLHETPRLETELVTFMARGIRLGVGRRIFRQRTCPEDVGAGIERWLRDCWTGRLKIHSVRLLTVMVEWPADPALRSLAVFTVLNSPDADDKLLARAVAELPRYHETDCLADLHRLASSAAFERPETQKAVLLGLGEEGDENSLALILAKLRSRSIPSTAQELAFNAIFQIANRMDRLGDESLRNDPEFAGGSSPRM